MGAGCLVAEVWFISNVEVFRSVDGMVEVVAVVGYTIGIELGVVAWGGGGKGCC